MPSNRRYVKKRSRKSIKKYGGIAGTSGREKALVALLINMKKLDGELAKVSTVEGIDDAILEENNATLIGIVNDAREVIQGFRNYTSANTTLGSFGKYGALGVAAGVVTPVAVGVGVAGVGVAGAALGVGAGLSPVIGVIAASFQLGNLIEYILYGNNKTRSKEMFDKLFKSSINLDDCYTRYKFNIAPKSLGLLGTKQLSERLFAACERILKDLYTFFDFTHKKISKYNKLDNGDEQLLKDIDLFKKNLNTTFNTPGGPGICFKSITEYVIKVTNLYAGYVEAKQNKKNVTMSLKHNKNSSKAQPMNVVPISIQQGSPEPNEDSIELEEQMNRPQMK